MNKALSEKETAEKIQGIVEPYPSLPEHLHIKAYSIDDPSISTTANTNVKTVHFIRHGQGFHNLMRDFFTAVKRQDNPYVMHEVVDAPLTQKGRDQARALHPRIRQLKDDGDNKPELIISSTLCRALQTASIAFEEFLGGKEGGLVVPFVAHEMVRESSGVHVCDWRRPISQQRQEFPLVEFGGVELEEDTLFDHGRRETKDEVGERIYNFMTWLSNREEKTLAVVSHSCWLLTVFNGVVECDDSLKSWFGTGEMRSVKLVFTDTK
mmetsp:Transcript_33840/g.40545  ORF Transcript_33840/g.40545 Transcript_33840/m.40545 type:complete len:266 (-) Transcript_33840:152-949(-)